MTTVKSEVAKLSDITGKVGAYVVEKIAIEEKARKATDENFEGRISGLETNCSTLIGTDTNKSVRTIATEVLTEALVADDATEAYDTLQEMTAWIQSHPDNAATMNQQIGENTSNIASINTVVEENERVVAESLTNLNGKIDTVDSNLRAYIEDLLAWGEF